MVKGEHKRVIKKDKRSLPMIYDNMDMHLLHGSGNPIYRGLLPRFRPFPPLVLSLREGNRD
jgi:hypothetical protein